MKLTLTPAILTLHFSGWERLWAVRWADELVIPRDAIVHVSTFRPKTTWRTLRAPGTSLPGVIRAGTYYTAGAKEFWYTTGNQGRVLTLELDSTQPYRRVVINLPADLGLDVSTLPM